VLAKTKRRGSSSTTKCFDGGEGRLDGDANQKGYYVSVVDLFLFASRKRFFVFLFQKIGL
jgi:hypothetical protein